MVSHWDVSLYTHFINTMSMLSYVLDYLLHSSEVRSSTEMCTGHFIILMVLSAFMVSFNLFDGRVVNPLNLSPCASLSLSVCVSRGGLCNEIYLCSVVLLPNKVDEGIYPLSSLLACKCGSGWGIEVVVLWNEDKLTYKVPYATSS